MSAHLAGRIEAAEARIAALEAAVRVYRDFPAARERVAAQLAAARRELEEISG